MGNYVSRHSSCVKTEAQACETPEQKIDPRINRILKLDPRSPTAEIVRTPIQVVDPLDTPNNKDIRPDRLDTPQSILSTLAMRSSEVDLTSLFDTSTFKEQSAVNADEFEELMDSIDVELAEIQESYKYTAVVKEVVIPHVKKEEKSVPCQKLRFSPERELISKPVVTKVRTPLGLRSTNTVDNADSPSNVIRMKQQRWVEEGINKKIQIKQNYSFNCENTPPKLMTKAATLPRKRQTVEWDKDTTIII